MIRTLFIVISVVYQLHYYSSSKGVLWIKNTGKASIDRVGDVNLMLQTALAKKEREIVSSEK